MELQPIKCVAIAEKLVRGEGGRPKPHTAGWNIKDVAVRMCGDKPGRAFLAKADRSAKSDRA